MGLFLFTSELLLAPKGEQNGASAARREKRLSTMGGAHQESPSGDPDPYGSGRVSPPLDAQPHFYAACTVNGGTKTRVAKLLLTRLNNEKLKNVTC